MKKLAILLFCILTNYYSMSQNVGIGTAVPHSSAKLEVSSTTQGMLVPRMTTLERNAISSPAAGLLVYDTNTNGFWFFIAGFGWSNLSSTNAGWQLTGNAGTDSAVNFIGTLDIRPLKFMVNNQRAGLIGLNGNIFFGEGSGTGTSSVSHNIAIGHNSLPKSTSNETIAIGAFAMNNNTSGAQNLAVGSHALEANISSGFNTAVGNYNLGLHTTGSANTAIGASVLGNHLRGSRNTAVGTNASFYDTTGNDNSALGYFGLFNNSNGSRNTAIGSQALNLNTIGNNNLGVGYKADALANNLQNASAIGAFARVDCNNCMVLGSVNGINGATSSVNVGIGNTNPLRPLSFPPSLGKKISLYPGASGDVGLGVFGNELRIHSDHSFSDVTFGYDDYLAGFTERLRIKNTGELSMELNGRVAMRNGTVPLDLNYGPGIWLTKPDNSSYLGFIGVYNNQNMGFYGGPAGWGFVYDAINSRVGIGTATPLYPIDVTGNLFRTGNFVNTATSLNYTGLLASCNNTPGFGTGILANGGSRGIYAQALLAGNGDRFGIVGYGQNGAGINFGVYGVATAGTEAIGVFGNASGAGTNWAGYFNGNVFTTGTYSSSDRKLKNNSKPLSGALSIINGLNPSVYTFKTTEYKQMQLPEGIHYGLMADEVLQVMPGIVRKAVQPAQYENGNEQTGKMLSDRIEFNAVNYTEIIPVLIAAIKEQQLMIEELKNKNPYLQRQMEVPKKNHYDALQNENERLNKKNKEIEARLEKLEKLMAIKTL